MNHHPGQLHSSYSPAFSAFLAQRSLRYARCGECGRVLSYNERICSSHPRAAIEWVPAGGGATLHTWVRYRIGYSPGMPAPYIVAVVELDEGPRLISTVVGNGPRELRAGCRLEAFFAGSGRLEFAME